ncbi:nicotinamide riboside transporter PnuC [Mollicutes bacterium LVI A0039]|nr:nicotinamide riboside transporter PnuC [Mollicutes bacterium LVI A0039]
MNNFITGFIDQFKGWSRFEKLLISVVTIMLLITSYMWQDTPFGIFTTLAGVMCVVLVAKGNRYNYFWGLINVTCYGIIAYNSNYAGDFILNIGFYLPMQFIGLYMWNKHYNVDSDTVASRGFTTRDWIVTIVAIAIGTIVIGLLMPTVNNLLGMEANPRPFVDAFTTFGSIYAQILMARRFSEQWYLWIVVNLFSIVMWITLKDSAMVIMFTAYLINAIYGAYNWKQMEQA